MVSLNASWSFNTGKNILISAKPTFANSFNTIPDKIKRDDTCQYNTTNLFEMAAEKIRHIRRQHTSILSS